MCVGFRLNISVSSFFDLGPAGLLGENAVCPSLLVLNQQQTDCLILAGQSVYRPRIIDKAFFRKPTTIGIYGMSDSTHLICSQISERF